MQLNDRQIQLEFMQWNAFLLRWKEDEKWKRAALNLSPNAVNCGPEIIKYRNKSHDCTKRCDAKQWSTWKKIKKKKIWNYCKMILLECQTHFVVVNCDMRVVTMVVLYAHCAWIKVNFRLIHSLVLNAQNKMELDTTRHDTNVCLYANTKITC